MRLLNSVLLVLLFCVSCSQTKQKQEDIPNAPDIIFGSGDSAAKDKDLSFEDFYNNALGYYQSKDASAFSQYIQEHRKLFTKDSSHTGDLKLLEGLAHLLKGKYSPAQNILESLIRGEDTSLKGRAFFYLAEIKNIQKEYSSAIKLYEKAYQLTPTDEIYSSIADTYAQMANWDKAIFYYNQVVKNNPHMASKDLFLLGAAYYQKKDYRNSKKIMQTLLKLDPKEPRAYEYLAEIAKNQHDMRNYYYYNSRALLLRKDYKSTINLLENVDLVYQDGDLASILISSFVRQQHTDKALETYTRAVKTNPKLSKQSDFKIYYGILHVIPQQGRQVGETYFKNLAKQYPNDFLVVSTYADVVESNNKSNPILESIFLQALFIDPTDTAVRYKLANFYQEKNQTDLSGLEYGILYYYQDQKDLALETLLGVQAHYPDFKNIQLPLYIGLLYQEKGEKDLALQYYKKALSIDKKNPIARLSIKKLTDKS